jgi:hypothetical protein
MPAITRQPVPVVEPTLSLLDDEARLVREFFAASVRCSAPRESSPRKRDVARRERDTQRSA